MWFRALVGFREYGVQGLGMDMAVRCEEHRFLSEYLHVRQSLVLAAAFEVPRMALLVAT